jgi:intein/homing endonuclease
MKKYVSVNLSEMPKDFYISIDSVTIKKIFRRASKNRKTNLPKLARELSFHWGSFWRWYNNKRFIKIENLEKVCECANLPIDKIQKHVNLIKGDTFCRHGLKIKMPLIINENWAYIAELLRTDGHIPKSLKEIEIANNDIKVLDILKNFLFSLGIKEGSIHEKPWNKGINIKICNRTFARLLNSIFEIPSGNKCGIIRIPAIIKISPDSVVASSIRGALDGDGWSTESTRRVGIQSKSKEYISDIHLLLQNRFNLISHFRGPSKGKYTCDMGRKENLKRFQELIGFNNEKRNLKLQRMLLSYKR